MKKALVVSVLVFFALVQARWAEPRSHEEAGYEWAKEHNVKDADYDDGNSDSFNAGVRAYAQEQQDEDPAEDAQQSAAEDTEGDVDRDEQ
jgi:hypothetical protein